MQKLAFGLSQQFLHKVVKEYRIKKIINSMWPSVTNNYYNLIQPNFKCNFIHILEINLFVNFDFTLSKLSGGKKAQYKSLIDRLID